MVHCPFGGCFPYDRYASGFEAIYANARYSTVEEENLESTLLVMDAKYAYIYIGEIAYLISHI